MDQNRHIGEKFDDFLDEEELLEEATATAANRIFVYQDERDGKDRKSIKETSQN